jgi:thioredoxin-related protein
VNARHYLCRARSIRFDTRPLLLMLALLLAAALPSARSEAAELIMFDKEGCIWCARWERDIGRGYQDSREGQSAPLRRVDIREQRRLGVTLEEPVIYTPTFILTEDGEEVGRITGYRGPDVFWASLDELLRGGRSEPNY